MRGSASRMLSKPVCGSLQLLTWTLVISSVWLGCPALPYRCYAADRGLGSSEKKEEGERAEEAELSCAWNVTTQG